MIGTHYNLTGYDLYLSPLRDGCHSYREFCEKIIKVFFRRIAQFISDLIYQQKLCWRNNQHYHHIYHQYIPRDSGTVLSAPLVKFREELKKRIVVCDAGSLCELLAKYPSTLDLFNKAQAELNKIHQLVSVGGIKFKFVPSSTFEKGSFALCDYASGTIELSSDREMQHVFSYAIYELCNMSQCSQFFKLHHSAQAGQIDQKDFATKFEDIEQVSWVIFSKVIETVDVKMLDGHSHAWGKEFARNRDFYLKHMKDSGHTQIYERYWDKAYKAQWEKEQKWKETQRERAAKGLHPGSVWRILSVQRFMTQQSWLQPLLLQKMEQETAEIKRKTAELNSALAAAQKRRALAAAQKQDT